VRVRLLMFVSLFVCCFICPLPFVGLLLVVAAL